MSLYSNIYFHENMVRPSYDYLAHYGVKGQKWGVRNYRNPDGTLTAAGRQHYGIGDPRVAGQGTYVQARVRASRGNVARANTQPKRAATPEEIQARKAKVRKYLAIAGGVTLAALAGYAAYKGSTKWRDQMREDVFKNVNTDFKNVHTLNSKYWNSADRKEYEVRSAQRAKDMAASIRRRDAVAAKLAQKTGIRINFGTSRKDQLAERVKANEYSNFIRDSERRAAANRQIHDARQALKKAQEDKARYVNTEHIGTSKRYEALFTQKHNEIIEESRKRLNDLLARRAG